MKEHEENLKKIYEHFCEHSQVIKLGEECCELISEVCSYIYLETDNIEEIHDEIADVLIVAYQLYMNNEKIRDRVKFKIDRTLKRIESGYYEN